MTLVALPTINAAHWLVSTPKFLAPNTGDVPMKEIIVGIIGLLTVIGGASWFKPDLINFDRLPVLRDVFISDAVKIRSDLVYVHVNYYKDSQKDKAFEKYDNIDVFDKAIYVEDINLNPTKGKYTINIASSGLKPEILSIYPSVTTTSSEFSVDGKIIHRASADLYLDQNEEYKYKGIVPNPKMIYIFRNGLQSMNSFGGKDVKYETDQLTFVYDFSSTDWKFLIDGQPQACRKNASEDSFHPIEGIGWSHGVAIIRAVDLKAGDRVRVFWNWAGAAEVVSCAKALNLSTQK